jgi:phosphopantetheinyl transferase (holo-ACP synthase)
VEEEDEASAGQIVKISISHDGEYATAVCLAADESSAGS